MKPKIYGFGLVIIILVHLFIFTLLIFFPYQELFTYPYFVNKGLLPYKQIMDQHFPGLMFFPINFATLGMTNEVIARYWAMGVVLVDHILLFKTASEIFKSEKKAIFANILFLIWQPFFEGWVLWIDSFLTIFLIAAFYFTYLAVETKKSKHFFMSGLMLGIGIIFKQVVAPLALLIGILLLINKNTRKKTFWFLVGLVPLPLLMLEYFWNLGVLKDFWYWTVTYNLTIFSEYGRKLPTFTGLLRVVAVYGMVFFALFQKNKRLSLLVLTFLLGSLAAAFARFDFVHFQPSLPFVILGTILALEVLARKKLLWPIISLYLIVIFIFLGTFYNGHLGNKIFFFDEETKLIAKKIRENTSPNERIFIFGSIPHLYQLSGTLPSGNIYVQQYSWFMKVSEEEILESIVADNPNLVVADRSVHVDGQYIVNYASKVDEYILDNYHTVDRVGTTQFMLRNKSL